MNHHFQYFTENIYSQLLIANIDIINPKLVIDLGIGDGALTKAAIEKWGDAHFFAIDVDKEKCDSMKHYSDKISIIQENGLIPDLNEKIQISVNSVDVAICNPPYHQIANNENLFELFKASSLYSCCELKRISSDIIFLAHNLSLLKDKGYLGIILPDGILTRKDYALLRKDIITNHTLKHVIQLPDGVFKKTEARTHILILTKGKSKYESVMLSIVDENGNYTQQLNIPKNHLIDRMDFSYQNWKLHHNYEPCANSIYDIQITRGSFSYKELQTLFCEYFHSTHFKDQTNHSFADHAYTQTNKVIAEQGDILMCRVGKRCVGKTSIIERGNIILSDCVYRIRVPQMYQRLVWQYFNSTKGKEWIQIAAHGVCSRVISKCDLYSHINYIIKEYNKMVISKQL